MSGFDRIFSRDANSRVCREESLDFFSEEERICFGLDLLFLYGFLSSIAGSSVPDTVTEDILADVVSGSVPFGKSLQ